MSKVHIIIGLPGSGKTSLRFKLDKVEKIYPLEDWMQWDIWVGGKKPTKEFNEDPRYSNLLEAIESGKTVLLTSIRFCDHEFLCKAEYYLKSRFPNLEIVKHYFENEPKKAYANVLYRDNSKGGHWKRNENNDLIYFGDHHNRIRCYEISLENIEKFSPNYIIPDKYTPIPIEVQDEKYYNGWRALIKEE